MISIAAHQVTPELIRLFDRTRPTMPRALNVLEGVNRGEILVDDPLHPIRGVVREAVYGTLYPGGEVDAALLDFLLRRFRRTGAVGIGCWITDRINAMIPADPDYDGRTLYFTERSPILDSQTPELPGGYSLVPRDERLFQRSFDYESTLASFGNVENVLRHTLGVVILDGETLVCEAATGAPTHGHIEVGVTTAEPYRGKGFATVACSHLIAQCERQGLRTWWDCAKQNAASVRLARRLGYHNEREYRYVWWAKT